MKHDIPEVQSDDRIHRHVKIYGKPKEPSKQEIKLFMTLVQSIAKRTRTESHEQSSRVYQSQHR